MQMPQFKRVPQHIGVIPDGNRRWAVARNMKKEDGYACGIEPGFALYKLCLEAGVRELTLYGFTQENTKRPRVQRLAYQKACVEAVEMLCSRDASLHVVGNNLSTMFPAPLLPYAGKRVTFGAGTIRVNFLVNYSWYWDLHQAWNAMQSVGKQANLLESIGSRDVSRIDLVIRWGGRRRLSGFLPVQSVYADFYVVDALWPDFCPEHFFQALKWYQDQDVTLGG